MKHDEADCMQSRTVHADCDTCGWRPLVLHMPTTRDGWYCSDCCPACAVKTAKEN